MDDKDCLKINNFAVIQYQLKNGDFKVLAFSDYDVDRLKHRVCIHLTTKKVLSVQMFYNVSSNGDLHLFKKGVILE